VKTTSSLSVIAGRQMVQLSTESLSLFIEVRE